MRLSPAQAPLMAQLYTAGGALRQSPLSSDPSVRPTVVALRSKGLVETYFGLLILTKAGWDYEDERNEREDERVSFETCPLCERSAGESRADAARRAEETAIRKPTAKNKRRVRLGRACFEPLSARQSKIVFLAEAQRDEDEMDIALFMASLGDLEPFLGPRERARQMAERGTLVEPSTPWWILENCRG